MGALAIVTAANPPLSGDVRYVGYEHAQDGELYEHQFEGGVAMKPMRDGSLKLTHAGGLDLHRDFSGQRFLVNPPRRRSSTMAHRLRYTSGPKKGQFRKRSRAASTRKKSTTRKRSSSRPNSRRRARRNPPRITARSVVRTATDGVMDAGLVLTGKALTRTIPVAANLPKEGTTGLAIQALTAVLVSVVARNVLKPQQAKMILAGGLSAPVETLIVSYDVPFLAQALQPIEGEAQVSAYMGGYVEAAPPLLLDPSGELNGYVEDGLGMYGEPTYA